MAKGIDAQIDAIIAAGRRAQPERLQQLVGAIAESDKARAHGDAAGGIIAFVLRENMARAAAFAAAPDTEEDATRS